MVAVTDLHGRPMHDLRISVIDECNYRCPYCMPAEIFGHRYKFLDRKELLSFEEIERVARVFAKAGVVKIKITGGEPLLRPWVHHLVKRLTGIDGIEEVALITNGSLLSKMADSLKHAGLSRLTVSLDSLDPKTYEQLNGKGYPIERVFEGLESAERAGFTGTKLNTVVQRGVNDHEVLDMVRHFRHTGYTVRFIEYMDVGTHNTWSLDKVVPSRELLDRIEAEYKLEPVEPRHSGEVATRYRFVDGGGEVGFISSITNPFCGNCSRVRLSADGKLYTCLFAKVGHDVREIVRRTSSDDELEKRLENIWRHRSDRYSEERTRATSRGGRVEMFHIGG